MSNVVKLEPPKRLEKVPSALIKTDAELQEIFVKMLECNNLTTISNPTKRTN